MQYPNKQLICIKYLAFLCMGISISCDITGYSVTSTNDASCESMVSGGEIICSQENDIWKIEGCGCGCKQS